MYWFSSPIFKAIAAVAGAAAVIGVAAAVIINANKPPKTQGEYIPELPELPEESVQASEEGNAGIFGQIFEGHDPSIEDAFYRAAVTILERDEFEASSQVSSSGVLESTYVSNEILFYDNRTEKCYVLGRSVTYSALGAVTVTHSGGAFGGTMDYDSSGAVSELYGDQIIEKKNYLDYTALPVRADVKESLVFTLVPTRKVDWVTTVVGGEVSLGPPMLFPPESLLYTDIGLIPGKAEIAISKTYSSADSVLDDLTGRLVKPSGTFNCEMTKISQTEAMQEIAQISAEIIENENKGEFIPELPPLPDEEADMPDEGNGLPVPEGYPQDILPLPDGAYIVDSEGIPNESGDMAGYSLTVKTKTSREDVLSAYGDLFSAYLNSSSFSANGATVLAGEKNGYSISVMILDNALGSEEETMIQLVIEALSE